MSKPIWYNPFNKHLIICHLNNNLYDVYYTKKQIIIKDLKFIWYYIKYIIIFLFGKFTDNITDSIINYFIS